MKRPLLYLTLLLSVVVLICYSSKSSLFKIKKNRISTLSDFTVYREACRTAAHEQAAFQNFKRNPFYNLLHEQMTFEQGNACLSLIVQKYPDVLPKMETFKKNDSIGNPRTFEYPSVGSVSPTTLRYIKTAAEIKELFGDLNGKKVLEIGGGYGGQCAILNDLFAFSSYTLVDLTEPLALAQKTLEQRGVKNVRFWTPEEIKEEEFDLVISHFTFTETGTRLQKQYIHSLFTRAKAGYLVCNFFPRFFGLKPFLKEELLSEFKKEAIPYKTIAEEPQTGKDNFVLIWNR